MRRNLSLGVAAVLLAVALAFAGPLCALFNHDGLTPGHEEQPAGIGQLPGGAQPEPGEAPTEPVAGEAYRDPLSVARYIQLFGELPPNYLTKEQARALGWKSHQGNLWDVAYGMSIGGDRFANREGLLPQEWGRLWYEADVNYAGGYRGAERIVFSHDGLIFYTDDHYRSFIQLYGEEVAGHD